jgi:hypothetical protein
MILISVSFRVIQLDRMSMSMFCHLPAQSSFELAGPGGSGWLSHFTYASRRNANKLRLMLR